MEIDIRTLFYIFSAGNIFIIIFFFAYIRLYKPKIPVINIFIVAKVLMFAHWLLFALRTIIHDFYSVVLANVFFVFGICLEIYCMAYANKVFKRKQFIYLNLIPVFILILFLSFITAPESTRVIIMSALISLIYMGGGFSLILMRSKSKLQYLSSYFFFLIAGLFLVRTYWVIFVDNTTELYTQNNIQILSYVGLFLVSNILTVLLLLILKEKDEEKIKKDNVKLQELNRNKDKFFSIIAHDLKSPLANLYRIGELLSVEDSEINEATRKKLTKGIYQSAKSSFNLLDNLLKWATSNSGLITYDPRQIDLKNIINENLDVFKQLAVSKKLNLPTSLKDELLVFADYNMINSVVRNLLSNAIKFTPENGKIFISASRFETGFIKISVEDTGVGIRKEDLVNLFDIESKYIRKGTHNEGGTGLGLKLCKEFVTKNGGKIAAVSKVNKGSIFYFTLPVRQDHVQTNS